MLGASSIQGELIEEWNSGSHSISLFRSPANRFSAHIQHQAGSQTEIDSAHIKYGILGTTRHDLLLQKIDQLAKEKIKGHIAVFCYLPQGQPIEVWIFEAMQGAAPLIKKAKEILKQGGSEKEEKAIDCYQKALKHLEIALKIQENQKGDIKELNSAILQLKKELFLLQIKRDLPLYLSSAQEQEANEVIELYKEEDLFSGLSEYLKAFGESAALSPYYLFLSALLDEHSNRLVSAIQNYLHLAEHHSDPLPCFKKAEELVKQTGISDPFALPHFFEKLDGNKLSQLRQTTRYPEDLDRLILQKDAVRMTFEKCLTTLNQHSKQTKAPTCFICFNVEEADVGKWLEQVLVPDLDRMGIQPLFCFRDLDPGKGELNVFQSLVRGADQVMIACTPGLKRKCEEGRKVPIGVSQEIRLARQRYNDPDKYETNFLLYLKGNQKTSCPDVFFEPIQGATFTVLEKSQESSVFNYYENAFEFFGGMRGISRTISRQVRDSFLSQVEKIFAGEINREALGKWREARQAQIEYVLKAVQEQVTKMTKMVHLPFPPKDFTGRQQELQDLHTACQNHPRVAITGLGGVGKTALAFKYANDHQADYQFIYHIPAGTSQLVRDGLLQLADDLHIPKKEKIEERLELLKRRLDQDKLEQKYLLIFDGIDQVEAFDELNKYLPERGNCLLLTTRMPEQSKIRYFELIELKPFSPKEAVSYLLKATGSKEEEKASVLAERLGRLPLALTHAAGYIRSRKISIHEYIRQFDQFQLKLFEDKRLNLLSKEEKTILTTWNISLNAIETVHQCHLAKEVIAFFAFLGQAPIPLDLVRDWFKAVHLNREELDLNEALRHLLDYSMIDGFFDFYQVHPLVQQVTHYQMVDPQKVFEQAFLTLTLQLKQFKEKDVNTWNPIKPIVPHALSLLEKRELRNVVLEKQNKFMNRLGSICHTHGNFPQALEVWQGSLKVSKKWYKNHPQLQKAGKALATSYHNIGSSLETLGKGNKAVECYQKALKIWIKVYGEDHKSVAASYNNLGWSLSKLGEYDKALDFYQKALNIWQKKYGEEHKCIAIVYNNIGLNLETLGKYNEALKYLQKGAEILLKLLGEDPAVAISYNNVGLCLSRLGKYDEALEYHQKALTIELKVLGAEHPDVAISYNNIGMDFQDSGKHDEALKYFQKALEILLKVIGEEHPDVGMCYNNIGLSLESLKKLDESLKYHRKALNIWLKVYDEGHPQLASSYHNIGCSLESLKKSDEAINHYKKALAIWIKVHGDNHPHVATAYNSIGSSLENLGKHKEAFEYYQKALTINLNVYGEEHDNVALSYNNTASSLESLGEYDQAKEYYQKALEIFKKVYSSSHPALATVRKNLSGVLKKIPKKQKEVED